MQANLRWEWDSSTWKRRDEDAEKGEQEDRVCTLQEYVSASIGTLASFSLFISAPARKQMP